MTAQRKNIVRQAVTFIIFIFVIGLPGKDVCAQGQRPDSNIYKGFTASFSTRSLLLSSDIVGLHGKDLVENGGQLGVVYGNNMVRAKVNVFGYYSSAGNTPGTTNLYTSNAALHFYPAQLFNKRTYRLQPYFSGGFSYDRFKFFGYYINREPGLTNYSQAEAPYLGKLRQISAMAGAGLELSLKDQYDFIHLFTEINYVNNISTKTGHDVFSRTELKNKTHFVIGISFGAIQ